MSYDMRIGDKYFNLTFNVSEMLYRHNTKGIKFLDNKTGEEAFHILLSMLNFFLLNKNEFEKLNPENGWGSWENTTRLLFELIRASQDNPKLKWKLSY